MERQTQTSTYNHEAYTLLERLSPTSFIRRALEQRRREHRQEKVNKLFSEIGELAMHH